MIINNYSQTSTNQNSNFIYFAAIMKLVHTPFIKHPR